ncbi:MAG TPA: vanadium-dependent haloperoxidase [Thermoanaerobaculia bacterium]|nr:vanadium-dependent haloperoxidase [Thermoanaerobaculia bacterium]
MAQQKKVPAKKAAPPAGSGAQQYTDRHPRPVETGFEKAVLAPSLSSAELAAVDVHECTPTKIKKTGSNGDETRYKGADGKPSYIGNFHKGLKHNDFGEVVRSEYQAMLKALKNGSGFDKIPLDLGRKLVNPQAGLATDVEGPDPKDMEILSAPRLDSAEEAAEAVELYWMALLRDVPFTGFATHAKVAEAADEISKLTEFTGPRIGGKVTPQTVFRGCSMGDNVGPYLSQFLLLPIPYGSLTISQRQTTVLGEPDLGPKKADYLTTFDEWLAIQNGLDNTNPPLDKLDPTPRHIRNMRDLGRYVQVDALYEAYLNACLILLGNPKVLLDPGNPYDITKNPPHPDSKNQIGFGTFGGPHILSLVTEVATRALKAVWFQKWFVNRRLRPEAFGGLIHVKREGVKGTKRDYPIHDQILNSKALAETRSKFGSYLLPMAFPEGSPTHPAYGAGHATVAGACVTILKAWFDEDQPLPWTPQVSNAKGDGLEDYTGPDAGQLTVGGELNKVAANIAIGRNMAGVHWRSDYLESVKLGEKVALSILYKQRKTYNEKGWSFTLRTFEGEKVTVSEKGVFDSKGKRVQLP